jgi:CBS domain-containing protein
MVHLVNEVMTSNPIIVRPETALSEAIRLLVDNKITGLPVVNEEGKLVGILTENDLMWRETGLESPPYIMILDSIIYLQNPSKHEKEVHKVLGQTVKDVMSDKVTTVNSHQSVKEAAVIMQEKRIRRLPVIQEQDGRLIGIVTQSDILRSMIN